MSCTLSCLKSEIIPEIERETSEQLSVEELAQLVQKVDEVVTEYDKQIEVHLRHSRTKSFKR